MINDMINYKCFLFFLSLNKGKKTEVQRSYLNKFGTTSSEYKQVLNISWLEVRHF